DGICGNGNKKKKRRRHPQTQNPNSRTHLKPTSILRPYRGDDDHHVATEMKVFRSHSSLDKGSNEDFPRVTNFDALYDSDDDHNDFVEKLRKEFGEIVLDS